MSSNQRVGFVAMSIAVLLAGVAGCGGSRNSSDPPEAQDFALGAGDVKGLWSSGSSDLIHDLSRGALYYLDVEQQNVIAINVASGDTSPLFSGNLLFEPSRMRMTTDSQELYLLESEDSANGTDGFPDLIRYNLSDNFIYNGFTEIDSNVVVDDFVPTTNDRIVLATHTETQSPTPNEQHLSLVNAFNGVEIDSQTFPGVVQSLALSPDQTTLLDQVMFSSSLVLNTFSIAGDVVDLRGAMNLTLAQAAISTYEPEGERIFRSSGTVWDGEEQIPLGSNYESIDFDLNDDRVVILVEVGNGFIIRYFDLDSLELLSEQTLPTVDAAAGMEPVKLFVDDGNLYVVYREAANVATLDYVLVEFEYP